MIKWIIAVRRLVPLSTVFILLLMVVQQFDKAAGRRNKEFKYSTPAPMFMQTESNYTRHRGERAILHCSVKHLGTKTVSWRKANETHFLTIGTVILTDDKRFEVAHTEDSTDWNLMISNVSSSDSGAYECQISSVDRGLRKEVFLIVKDEFSYADPHITLTGTLHVDRGRVLTLICNASGSITPPDYIDWFKDGTKIVAGGSVELTKKFSYHSRTITSVFTKSGVKMSDTGTYSCRTSDLQVTSVSVQVLNTNKSQDKRGGPHDGRYTLDSSESSFQRTSYSLLLTFISAFSVCLFT